MNRTDAEKNLLAIDTSTPAASVALQHKGRITARFHAGHAKHTEVLLPMINELLNEAGITPADLNGIIVSIGPGAFTGLRVGASIAAGLAAANSTPLAGISSLALLAAGSAADGVLLPVLDARMGQVYAGVYQREAGKIGALIPDFLASPDEALSRARESSENIIITGPGAALLDTESQPLPDARHAFALAPFAWQNAFEPVELNYLRNDIVQGAKEQA